jgi:hypothetical protein
MPVAGPSSPSETLEVVGAASLRRVGRWGFPTHQVLVNGEVAANLGRAGWWRIFFGRGQRIELPGGRRWRLRATGRAGAICPVIVDQDARKVAIAAPAEAGYGLSGAGWSYLLYPAEGKRFARSNQWVLRELDENVGVATRSPRFVETSVAVPLSAVLLVLTLVVYAIPGEDKLFVPEFRWSTS